MADLIEITRQHEGAMQIVHDLESSLVDANASELYWRRLRRKAVAASIAERMSDDTAVRSDDDAPPVPEEIKKAEVAKGTVGDKMGEKEVEEKKTTTLKRALGKKPVADKPAPAPPGRMHRLLDIGPGEEAKRRTPLGPALHPAAAPRRPVVQAGARGGGAREEDGEEDGGEEGPRLRGGPAGARGEGAQGAREEDGGEEGPRLRGGPAGARGEGAQGAREEDGREHGGGEGPRLRGGPAAGAVLRKCKNIYAQ